MNFKDFLIYLAFINLIFGSYVLAKNPRSRQNISFFVLCFGIGFWILGFFLLGQTHSFYFPDKILLFGGILLVGGFYAFSKAFPEILPQFRNEMLRTRIYKFAPLAVLSILLPFNLFIKNDIFNGDQFLPVNGPLFPVYALTTATYILLTIKNFYQQFKNSLGYKRQRILYVFLGLGIFLSSALVFDLLLPGFGRSELKLIGPFASAFFTVLAAFSIVSYQLMDIRLLLRAIVANALSLVFVVSVLGLFERIHFELTFPRMAFVLLIAITAFVLIRYWIGLIYDALLLKSFFDFEQGIDQLNMTIRQELEPAKIILAVNSQLKNALNLSWIFYFDVESQKMLFGPDVSETKLSEQAVFDDEVKRFASNLSAPYFITHPEFTAYENHKEMPVAILPLFDSGDFAGYFLLGPRKGFLSGLSSAEVRKIQTTWAHIQTAYSRAILYQNLEKRVKAQVKDITYKTRKLKENTENRLEFVRMASHQLRSPVTALSGSLQILTKRIRGKENRELIDIAYSRSRYLAELITGVLSLARLERDELQNKIKDEVDLNKIFSNILQVIEPAANAKNIAVEYFPQPNLRVVGNLAYLEQAFFNILENAVDFTESGYIKVYFQIENDYIITCIEDSGIGIEDKIKNVIFKKHTHGANSKGVGIGLYLVRAIINAHPKGHVWFESNKSGTTFYIRLKKA